jgi:cytochrome-b5 reductase
LPADSTSGLHVASCVITRKPITKKDGTPGYIIRPYTPTSDESAQGYVDFIVKKYPDGKMSKHFHDLKVGDELEIKGPIPKLKWEENKFNNVGLIAGKSKRRNEYTLMA